MAINKNHEFEDLDGVKCAVVERNVSAERVAFLQNLLAYNSYKVIVVASPPPKAAAAKPAPAADVAAEDTAPAATPPPPPATFTVGVTDVTFNAVNAVFGRLLHARNGQVVTLAYWQQKATESLDEVPYFEETI
jgi:hypothetical protein